MTKLRGALLIGAGTLALLVVIAGTFFYIRIYKPITSPLMAMSTARILEERRLVNHDPFSAPGSGELSADQVRRFVSVEQAVETQVAAGAAALAAQQAALERAHDDGQLTVRATFSAFGGIKPILMDAKMTQIDAMNREHFSKKEFEWVRNQLYRAASLRLTRIDVSDILDGVQDAAVRVRTAPDGPAPESNRVLAQPLAAQLERWRAFGFFGL
jgi:hypothetical protein